MSLGFVTALQNTMSILDAAQGLPEYIREMGVKWETFWRGPMSNNLNGIMQQYPKCVLRVLLVDVWKDLLVIKHGPFGMFSTFVCRRDLRFC